MNRLNAILTFAALCTAMGAAADTPQDTLNEQFIAAVPHSDTTTSNQPFVNASGTHLTPVRSGSVLMIPDENFARNEDKQGWFRNKFSLQFAPNVKEYKFKDEMTYAGLPLLAAGIAVRGKRTSFRQDYNNEHGQSARLITNFHTRIDDWTQMAPLFLATGLNIGGYEGRSTLPRYAASAALSYAIVAAIVNPIKYTAKEMRPDGSTANSFPSGHTATAFAGATILHKEYGLTRSPWFSIGGYAVATGTGIMRVLNNRHWVSDVFAGAGIGILSTELGYGLSDLLFKRKGLLRNDLDNLSNAVENPTFFSLSMGMGFGDRHLTFDARSAGLYDEPDGSTVTLKFRPATAVGVEGAYFFNKYVGVGGRFRVLSTPVSGWDGLMLRQQSRFNDIMQDSYLTNELIKNVFESVQLSIESDHLTEFTADAGVYFNIPLSNRLALGSKLLVGRSIYQALDINGYSKGNVIDFDVPDNSDDLFSDTGNPYEVSWDYLTVTANNTTKFGTGLSLTYAYKNGFAWRVFADYDFSRKRYTMKTNDHEFIKHSLPGLFEILDDMNMDPEIGTGQHIAPTSQSIKKNSNHFVFGAALQITL